MVGVRPRDLLLAAEHLANTTKQGKPKTAFLRRAVSTSYYAMFHSLARASADLFIGAGKGCPAWVTVYRSLEHGTTKNACKNLRELQVFPKEIQDFSYLFVAMQEKRHDADYNPTSPVYKSAVLSDISAIRVALADFENCSATDRRAFAAYVIFKPRKSS